MKRIHFLLLFLVVASMSACLKDSYKIPVDDNTDRLMTEFTTAKEGVNSLALTYGTQMIEVDLTELRVPPRAAMSGSVQVKIALNNALATAEGYAVPPSSAYSIVGTDYTLTPTAKKANVRIKVNPSALVGDTYAIGLTIQNVSAGEINQAAKDIIIELKVKNAYEGEYYASGERILYAGPTLGSGIASIFAIDVDKYAYTIDQNTVETDVADLVGGGWMFLEVNPATNNVTVKPSTLSPTFLLSNNGPCTWDPATRTFTLNYKYFNAAGNLRTIVETLEMK
jgi:hypothetical protein